MRKFIMLLIGMSFLSGYLAAQATFSLSGHILDENNQLLPGATVFLNPTEKGTITDDQGDYLLPDLKKGVYTIKVFFIGYKTLIDTIQIRKDRVYNAKLALASLSLQEVVITDNYAEERKKEDPLSVEIVNEDYLKRNLGGSLMKSLERLPGVSTIDIGSGQSKPVIRGLGFNRVVVVENGIKHEGQQWGADHGLEIDQYALDNIEVIKGPASLMYGSDAIGGVIDVKQNLVPEENTLDGTIDLIGKSNNDQLGTSLSVSGRKKSFFAILRATFLDYGDYKVPTDSVDIYSFRVPLYQNHLRNTAGREQNLHLTFGIINKNFQSRFFVSNVYSKSGFFANAHGLEPRNVDNASYDASNRDIKYPFQEVSHFKAINKSRFLWSNFKLETDIGFQRNYRQEWSQYVSHGYMPALFPDALAFNPDLERQFDKVIYSGIAKLSYSKGTKASYIFGLSSEYQNNKIDGRGFIIPAFDQLNVGGFAIMKYAFTLRSLLQLGVRCDFGNIHTFQYNDWFQSPVISSSDTISQYLERAQDINRNFSNLTWSVGYNYNPENWSFKVNVGKSFRMPIAKELAANGVNYHHFSYEVGDADLSPEVSYQLDLGIEYYAEKFAIGATPFFNYFSNYIYLNPSAEHDRLYGNGNQVYYYTQSEVLRYGGEIHTHYQLTKPVQVGLIGEYVYSEQRSGAKKGFTLPFSPPASLLFNVKWQQQNFGFIEDTYASLDFRVVAAQNKIVPPEEQTKGYQLVNLGFGGTIRMKNQQLTFKLQIQNLLNAKYFNHTSYYRLINVPEPGRNFILTITIPFSKKI